MKIRVGFGPGVAAGLGIDGETFWTIIDACEALGWDSIWFSERVGGNLADPLAGMAAVAGRTQRLKFGTSVLVIPGRNPVLLAKQLATIDVLSGGRLIAAVGLGAEVAGEQEAFGVDRAEAGPRTEEAVALIRRLWSEDRVTFRGRFFSVTDLALGPRPVQKPHPDVWFGGRSRAALRRVAQLGDGWLPSFVTVDEYPPMAESIRVLAAEAGREIDEEHFGALVPYVPDGAPADQILAALSARRPGADPTRIAALGVQGLRGRLEEFVEKGASKFVVIPAGVPGDWGEELARLRESVARPLEN